MFARLSRRSAVAAVAVATVAVATVAVSTVAVACCPGPGVAWARARAPRRAFSPRGPAAVWVRPVTVGRPVPRGFVGLSFEYGYVFPYTGTDPGLVNPVLVKLIDNLDPEGGFVLRVGGDSTDWSWWPVAGMPPPVPHAYPITPAWIAMVRALLDATRGRVILGINLEAGSLRIAAAEGRALLDGLGRRRIAALEIGNEPEQYSTRWYGSGGAAVPGRPPEYDFSAFLNEFARWRRVLPGLPLAGPATGSVSWLAGLPRLLSAQPRLAQVTVHRYPLSNCGVSPSSPEYPTVANLLATSASRHLASGLAPYVRLAHRDRRTFRVDELNSVTCQGHAGVSDTAASALWALDTLFEMAAVGVDAVNFHMWAGAGPNQLFTFEHRDGRWTGSVRPIYYGLLMFDRAAPPGSRLLRTDVSGPPDVRAWATVASNHVVRIVVIDASPNRPRTVVIHPPVRATASLQRLRSPSPYATGGMTIAGQSFGTITETGLPVGPLRQTAIGAFAAYRLTLAPGSAVLLTLTPAPARPARSVRETPSRPRGCDGPGTWRRSHGASRSAPRCSCPEAAAPR